MSLFNYAIKGNLNNFLTKLDKLSKDTNIKKYTLFNKFLYCFLIVGSGYSDFLNYEFYKKTKSEIKEYATIKDQDKFYEIVSPSIHKKLFTIKPNFLNAFKQYIKRDFFYKGSLKELKDFLKNNDEFMIKPIDGLGGFGVKKMKRDDIKDIDIFYDELINENRFIEGFIKQHKKMNKLCPTCVNTLRVMTYGANGKSDILFAALRVGDGHHDVDNFHAGGLGVLVDIKTGKLVGCGIDKNVRTYRVHPLTKVKFDKFIIPNWNKVKSTVLSAALVSNDIHVVAWDVAITEDGCEIIEGNRRGGFDIVQVPSKRGRKDIMRDVIKRYNEDFSTNYKI